MILLCVQPGLRRIQKVEVDILAKVRHFQNLPKKSGLEKMIGSNAARLFAQDVDARLGGIVI